MSTPTEPLTPFDIVERAMSLGVSYQMDRAGKAGSLLPDLMRLADQIQALIDAAYQRGRAEGIASVGRHCESCDGSAPECWDDKRTPTASPLGQSERQGSRGKEERP